MPVLEFGETAQRRCFALLNATDEYARGALAVRVGNSAAAVEAVAASEGGVRSVRASAYRQRRRVYKPAR